MHDHNVLVGQLHSGVCCRNLGIIPFLDLPKKNSGDRFSIKFKRWSALEIVSDDYSACDRWDVQEFSRSFLEVLVTHWPVGCTEIHGLRHDLLLSASGTDRLIIEPNGRIDLSVFVKPLGINRIRERR